MGQYFIICNLTKKQQVKPAFGHWKFGQWDWYKVIKIMGWEITDQIFAYSDSGLVYKYHPNRNVTRADDSSPSPIKTNDSSPSPIKTNDFECKYICEIRNIVLDQPYGH